MADSECRDECNNDKKRQKRNSINIDEDDDERMTGYDSRSKSKKRQKQDSINVTDGDDDDEEPRRPQNSLGVMFDDEILLYEALPYLDAVSIVDKKIVCKQWKEKCDVAIDNKGREGRKKRFVNNKELCDAVKKYCKGKRDEIENVAEEYGYPMGKWNVSRVKDFSYAFFEETTFNEDIGAWDVGNATNMRGMFDGAESFNQSLSGWNVSNVKEMCCMFYDATEFNGDVSTWDTSSVTGMWCMFGSAMAFNGDISNWDTSSVTEMAGMFWGAVAFDGDISSWNVSRVAHDMGCVWTASNV